MFGERVQNEMTTNPELINDLLVPERCCLGRFLIPTRRRYMSYSQRTNQYMYTAKIRSQMGSLGWDLFEPAIHSKSILKHNGKPLFL